MMLFATHRLFTRLVSILTLMLFFPASVQAWTLVPIVTTVAAEPGSENASAEQPGVRAPEEARLTSQSVPVTDGLLDSLRATGGSLWHSGPAPASASRPHLPEPVDIAELRLAASTDPEPPAALSNERLEQLKAGEMSAGAALLADAQDKLDRGELVSGALQCMEVQDKFTRTEECVMANRLLSRLETAAANGDITQAVLDDFEASLPSFDTLKSAEAKYTYLTFLHHIKAFGAEKAGRAAEAAEYHAAARDAAWILMNEHPDHPIQINVLTLYYESLVMLGPDALSAGMKQILDRVRSGQLDFTNFASRCILGRYLHLVQADPGMAWLQRRDVIAEAQKPYVQAALQDPGIYPWVKAFIEYQVGMAYLSVGQHEKALNQFQHVVDTYASGEAVELAGYGVAYTRYLLNQDDPVTSLQAFADFVKQFPNSQYGGLALAQMGKIYMLFKDYTHAMQMYQQVLAYYPDSEVAAGASNSIEYLLTNLPEFFGNTAIADGVAEPEMKTAQLCGPLALRQLLALEGIESTVEELAGLTNADESGTSMLALIDAARAMGLELVGVQANSLAELTPPALAHVNGDHFVVVTGFDDSFVHVSDLGLPAEAVGIQVFMNAWNGYALVRAGTVQVADGVLALDQLVGARGGSLTPDYPDWLNPDCVNNEPPCDPKCPCDCAPPGGDGGGGGGMEGCSPPSTPGNGCGGNQPPLPPEGPQMPDGPIMCSFAPCDFDGGGNDCRISPPGPSLPGAPVSTNPRGLARLDHVAGPGVNAKYHATQSALQIKETDLVVSTVGGMRISFSRMFHNVGGYSNENWVSVPYRNNIGTWWAHSLSMKLHTSSNTDTSQPSNPPLGVVYYDQNGAPLYFEYVSTQSGYDLFQRTNGFKTGENAVVLKRDTSTGKFYLEWPSGLEYRFSAAASAYDYVCRLEYIENLAGNQSDFEYDGAVGTGRLTKITLPTGDSRYFSFGYALNKSVITKASVKLGATTLQEMNYAYDANDALTRVTDRDGRYVTYHYGQQQYQGAYGTYIDEISDKAGNVTTLTWTYTVNSAGHWSATNTQIDGPTGLRTNFARHGDTNVVTVTTSYGGTTYAKYVYTPGGGSGWYVSSFDYYHDPAGGTADGWDYQYADGKHLTKIIAPDASTYAEYTYNSLGRLSTTRISTSSPTTYYYAEDGLYPTRKVGPTGLTTYYYYDYTDHYGRLTRMVPPGPGVNGYSYSYDLRGQITKVTDALGKDWRYAYDSWGRLVTKMNPLFQYSVLAYDDHGNVTRSIDPRGNSTFYEFDIGGCGGCGGSAGVLTKMIDAGNQQTTYGYDGLGRLTRTTDALNRSVDYAYDEYGRMTEVTAPAGSGISATTAYNILGQVSSTTDFEGRTTSYYYDHIGRVTRTTGANGEVKAAFSALGLMTKITDESNHDTLYEYDGLRRLTKVTDAIGKVTRYEYDALSRTTKVGAGATGTTDPTEYYYHATTGMLTQSRYTAGGSNHSAYYHYDDGKRLTKLTDWIDGTDGLQYFYDDANRLLTLRDYDGSQLTYGYDANGNVTTMVDYHGSQTFYTYTVTNRLSTLTAPGNDLGL